MKTKMIQLSTLKKNDPRRAEILARYAKRTGGWNRTASPPR